MGIERLMEGNQAFVEGDYAKDIDYYKELLKGQNPHAMLIGCCDSRVVPEITCHAKPGEIFVHRNIGNIVPPVTGTLEHSWNTGFVTEGEYSCVCGHEECGAMKALPAGEW